MFKRDWIIVEGEWLGINVDKVILYKAETKGNKSGQF
jgi:hypothetical protein